MSAVAAWTDDELVAAGRLIERIGGVVLAADESGSWVTINGVHVFISDKTGTITKGPKGLVGTKPGTAQPGRRPKPKAEGGPTVDDELKTEAKKAIKRTTTPGGFVSGRTAVLQTAMDRGDNALLEFTDSAADQWAASSDTTTSIELRRAAAGMWGGDVYVEGEKKSRVPPVGEAIAFAKIQYAVTQELLGKGPAAVTLYRGMALPGDYEEGDPIELHAGALSSFSESTVVAKRFGNVMVSVKVPRRYVFANHKTGFGVGAEREWVVLGDKREFAATVEHVEKELAEPEPRPRKVVHVDEDEQNQKWLETIRKGGGRPAREASEKWDIALARLAREGR